MHSPPCLHLVLLLAALLLSFPARAADTIFDNGSSSGDDGWEMTVWFEADDFVLQERTQLSGVRFWNYAREGYFTGVVTWQLWTNSSVAGPGQLIASGTSSNLTHSPTGYALFNFLFEAVTTFDITPVTLDPGIYWLALHNGPREHVTRGMYWAPTAKKAGSGAPSHNREALSDGPWYSNDYPGYVPELAFQVFGTVVPRLAGTGFVNGVPVVRFISKVGKQYRLEYKNSFAEAFWSAVAGREVINGTGGEIQADDPHVDARTAGRRFYRVVVL